VERGLCDVSERRGDAEPQSAPALSLRDKIRSWVVGYLGFTIECAIVSRNAYYSMARVRVASVARIVPIRLDGRDNVCAEERESPDARGLITGYHFRGARAGRQEESERIKVDERSGRRRFIHAERYPAAPTSSHR